MTPEKLIIFLKGIMANPNVDNDKAIIFGPSEEQAIVLTPENFWVVNGHLLLNTAED